MSRLVFRNVDASPDDPVESWPVEAMQTAVERGELSDWRRILRAVRRDPWGDVARTLQHILSYERPYGTAELLERALRRERDRADAADRAEAARRLALLLSESAMSQRDFAERLGTSQPRLSTYLAGTVTPSAALLVRAERVARSARGRRTKDRRAAG